MKRLIFILLACFCVLGAIVIADQNMVALHLSSSPQYNPDCLASGCHDTLLQNERTLDSGFVASHHRMIPYMPGYNPAKGADNDSCRNCHRSVDLINASAANLLKNVSPQNCVVCHSTAGPGKPLYK